jgi:hypothetical protein
LSPGTVHVIIDAKHIDGTADAQFWRHDFHGIFPR